MAEIALSRQPIFDRHLETVAYELRYGQLRGMPCDPSTEAERFLATLVDTGFETVVGSRHAVFSLPVAVLASTFRELLPVLPAERLILALDPVEVQERSLTSLLGQFAAQGCQLLLDCRRGSSLSPDLLSICDIVRWPVPSSTVMRRSPGGLEGWLSEQLALVAPYRAGTLRVLISDIRDYVVYARARESGVDLFQGDFLFRPVLVRGQRTPVSNAALVLLARLYDPAIDFEEVERLLAQDVELTYKLLKLVNTVWFARRTRIESLRQALLVLGLRTVAAWVTVLVLTGVERKPVELVRTALVRARMCELLAGALGSVSREAAFLTGLLSVLDAVLDRPLREALAEVPLASEVEAALLEREGLLGLVLRAVLAYETGDWDAAPALPLAPGLLTDAYIDALAFAAEILAALDVAA